MSDFLRAVRAGFDAVVRANGPRRYQVAGRILSCPACGHDRFVIGTAQLQTSGMSFVGLDWTQKESSTLACVVCSRIEWFLNAPEAAAS